MGIEFIQQRGFTWPWQSKTKVADRGDVLVALKEGKADRLSVRLDEGYPELPLRSREDLQELEAFAQGRPPEGNRELGQALIGLAKSGWSFHGTAGQLGLYGAYNALTDPNFSHLGTPQARKEGHEVTLDADKARNIAGFYASGSLPAQLEQTGYQFFEPGQESPVLAFEASPGAGLGRSGEVWIDGPLPAEEPLKNQLAEFQQLLGECGDVATVQQALAILHGGDSADSKARALAALEREGLGGRALDFLATAHKASADVARVALGAAESSELKRDLLRRAVESPEKVGRGEGLLQGLSQDDAWQIAPALMKAQTGPLAELGSQLLQESTSRPGTLASVLLGAMSQPVAPLDLTRQLLAAEAEPGLVMSLLQGEADWKPAVDFLQATDLRQPESRTALAKALFAGEPPAGPESVAVRVGQALEQIDRDDSDYASLVEAGLTLLKAHGPAAALAEALEEPELALASPNVTSGQDVIKMGRLALSHQETLSEEANGALLQALKDQPDTRSLGELADRMTSEVSFELAHDVLDALLAAPPANSAELAKSMQELLKLQNDPENGSAEEGHALGANLLKELAKDPDLKPLCKLADKLVEHSSEENGLVAEEAARAVAEGRGTDLTSFKAACVGLDSDLDAHLAESVKCPLLDEMQTESGHAALLAAAIGHPKDERAMLSAALHGITDSEDEDVDADRAALGVRAAELLEGKQSALLEKLTTDVDDTQHWAVAQALLDRPNAPSSLAEAASFVGDVAGLSWDPQLAQNLQAELAAFPETARACEFVDSLADDESRPALVEALAKNPRAASPVELAQLGSNAIARLSSLNYDADPLAEALQGKLGEEPVFQAANAFAEQVQDTTLAQHIQAVMAHPDVKTGRDYGALASDLFSSSRDYGAVELGLEEMAKHDDTRIGAEVASDLWAKVDEDAANLLGGTLLRGCDNPASLATQLREAADRGEKADEDNWEAPLGSCADELRAAASRLEARTSTV